MQLVESHAQNSVQNNAENYAHHHISAGLLLPQAQLICGWGDSWAGAGKNMHFTNSMTVVSIAGSAGSPGGSVGGRRKRYPKTNCDRVAISPEQRILSECSCIVHSRCWNQVKKPRLFVQGVSVQCTAHCRVRVAKRFQSDRPHIGS